MKFIGCEWFKSAPSENSNFLKSSEDQLNPFVWFTGYLMPLVTQQKWFSGLLGAAESPRKMGFCKQHTRRQSAWQ